MMAVLVPFHEEKMNPTWKDWMLGEGGGMQMDLQHYYSPRMRIHDVKRKNSYDSYGSNAEAGHDPQCSSPSANHKRMLL